MQKLKWLPLCMMLLSACAVGPDYHRAPVNVPIKFKEAKGKSTIAPRDKSWKKAQPKDTCQRGDWWTIFNDPKLNQLENQLNLSNQTIVNAYYNYRQARALVDEARAGFFPTLVGSLSLTRQKSGGGSSNFVSTSSTGTTTTGTAAGGGATSAIGSTITNSHAWIFNASWEPDIWGLVRRTVESNATGAQASAALYAATRLSSQASLAQFYFELRGLDNIQKVLDDTVAQDKQALQLTRNQYASGTVPRANIVQAQSVLQAAQAQALNNGILRGQYEHAIAVLIGLPPAEFGLPPYAGQMVPPAIPVSIPSAILERRPDIAQAERLMAQANANIGIAVAAYYPTLTLTGSASTAAEGFGHLFSVPALNWALGTQIAQTIYDGGLRNAQVKVAEAAYCASVAAYRQTVLVAFQDVEDNLVSLRILNQQMIVERQSVASARTALNLVINQYKSGVVPYSSVITAQTTLLSAEQSAVTVEYLRMTSAVGLIEALGGGWHVSNIACAAVA